MAKALGVLNRGASSRIPRKQTGVGCEAVEFAGDRQRALNATAVNLERRDGSIP
jgi:hypothetical protein